MLLFQRTSKATTLKTSNSWPMKVGRLRARALLFAFFERFLPGQLGFEGRELVFDFRLLL